MQSLLVAFFNVLPTSVHMIPSITPRETYGLESLHWTQRTVSMAHPAPRCCAVDV